MLTDLFKTFLLIVAGIILYRYHAALYNALRQFDRDNRARIEAQMRERQDPLAHFHHTLSLAEEQVEQVVEMTISDPRTAEPVKRFVFAGEHYLDRADAEQARDGRVREIARQFYRELPRALTARNDGRLN